METAHHGTERRGLILALLGFATLSIGDTIVKTMAGQWAASAVTACRYAFGALGLAALVAAREGVGALRPVRPALQLLRGVSVAVATIGFAGAVFIMPLADATAIVFVSPMLTGLLSALFLGEPARRETWIATVAAFAGVLVVLRPNLLALGPGALLPLLTAGGMSLLIIGNRALVGSASALAQQFYAAVVAAPVLVAIAVAGAFSDFAPMAVGVPSPSVVARCAIVAVTATTGHWLIYRGTVLAGAGAVAPMAYVQILVVALLGWAVFGNVPAPLSVAGMMMIVGAGLYLWRAGRMREPVEVE
ncbi:DMT family transporter [Novosphingobium flavum]|uniref:DMT family transporter n=1 Tax=Novosphingobium flavum TaxID=1778672 RepID=A0A7X1KL64_9SPHN|nr:DMT family transporter [Novosphingobium flavum]MBC2664993.1 DMT family transporter [Novosphingobium flavum]